MTRVLLLGTLVLQGCFTRQTAERAGRSGWFRVEVAAPAATYRDRFVPLPLTDLSARCEELVPTAAGPVIVLVHGVGGDGPEMEDAVAQLKAAKPRAVYMMRWVPYDDRDAIAERLAAGVSRLATCLDDTPITVIAHSAGGVAASFAVSRMHLPPGAQVTLLTVASALAGNAPRAGNPDGSQEATFFLDLLTRIAGYRPAGEGVRVVHLRTEAPADPIMATVKDLLPNDRRIGVPGAEQLDLPSGLSHAGSLHFVVSELVEGRIAQWLSPLVAATR